MSHYSGRIPPDVSLESLTKTGSRDTSAAERMLLVLLTINVGLALALIPLIPRDSRIAQYAFKAFDYLPVVGLTVDVGSVARRFK